MRAHLGVLIGLLMLTLAAGASHQTHLTFEITDLPPERDPFDRPLTWLLRFDGDDYSTSTL